MNESMGLGIKLVVYGDEYRTTIVKEVTGFNNAREAAHYRDHSEYAGAPSELQLDYNNYLESPVPTASDDMRDLAVDDGGKNEAPRQSMQYSENGHFWANFRFYTLVVFMSGGALFSFACLIFSVLAGPR